MNKRAHIRRPVTMPVRLAIDSIGDVEATVQDFCLGGMLVQLSAVNARYAAALAVGDAVVVLVKVAGMRGEREVRLSARIARNQGDHLGISFQDPDATALLAVQNHVRELRERDAEEGAQPPADNSAQAERGLAVIRQVVDGFAVAHMEKFFPDAHEALLEAAETAHTNQAQQPYFEAGKTLKAQHESLSRNFLQNLHATLEKVVNGEMLADDGMKGGGDSRLSLVDKDSFEDWLTLKVMASRAEGKFHEELLHLQLRLDQLFGISLSARRNPLHPAVICSAFGDALRRLPLRAKTDKVILSAFDEAVVNHLDTLYKQANELLAEEGVLADLDVARYISERFGYATQPAELPETAAEAPPAAGTTRPGPGTPASDAGPAQAAPAASEPTLSADAEPAATAPAQAGEAAEQPPAPSVPAHRPANRGASLASRQFALQQHIARHAYDTVQKLLSVKAMQAAQARNQAQDEAGAADAAIPTLTAADVDAPLAQLQAAGGGAPDVPLETRIAEAVQGDGEATQLGSELRAAIELIHHLFQGMVSNPALSELTRTSISRLEVPFLRLLLTDDSFLAQEHHPARQVLNRMAHLGVRGTANLEQHEQAISQEVDDILSSESNDINTFRSSLEKLDDLRSRQESLYIRNLKRVTEACEGKQKLVQARREVNKALERRIGGKQVPRAVLGLIDAGWRQLLTQILLRHGRDSKEWHQNLGIIDRLITAATKVPPQSELSDVLAGIKQGLGEVDPSQIQNARLIGDLRDLLSIKVRRHQDPALVDVPVGAVDEEGEHEARNEIHARWMKRARRHGPGDWFTAHQDGDETSLKLAWVDGEGTTFVFVNHQGMKILEYSLEDFADHLSNGTLVPLDSLEAPAVDRGLEHMVQRVYDQMSHQATHDELSGLLNRREFERRLRVGLSEPSEHGSSLIHMDLDQFKVINNMSGPEAGDEMIRQVANLLHELFPGALVARMGGDEFAIWLNDVSEEAGIRAADTVLERIGAQRFICGGRPQSISASFGVAHRKSPEITAAELTRSADTACHAAKEAGRNRVQHYRTDDKELMRRDDIMAWVTRLNDAMDENRVVLRCQRIERTDASGKPSYEVLIAITGDEGEMIAPSEFLRAAEQYNRMHTLDRWVLGNVFRWMHANSAVVQQLDHLSINLSGHSMNDANLGEYLFDLFERYPVPRDRLCFEVTETAAIANLEDAIDFITELQDMGCRFSLDDFGSGLASYGHLKSLPVDYIKIDGSFIRNVANDDADLALVRSINEMGHLMGKQTIAEYVENDEIRDCMAQIGVDYVQGYGVEKPRPLDTLVTDLAAPA
jgi:diguanylate cyclase (GGDEF)-like protein